MTNLLWISYSGFREPDNIMAPHGPTAVLTNLKKTIQGIDGKVCNLNDPFLYGYPKNPHVPSQDEMNSKLMELIEEYSTNILFATGWVNDYAMLLKSMNHAKENSKNKLLTALGGPHPTWFPEMTLNNLSSIIGKEYVDDVIDVLVVGEGDLASQKILEYFKGTAKRQHIPGAYWLEDGKIMQSKEKTFRFDNLDNLAFADWKDFMNLEHHWPVMQIDHNRGCSYNCLMCGHHPLTGSVMRIRNPKSVAQYIDKIFKEHRIRHFRFSGSELSGEEAEAISDEIIKKGLEDKIVWSCFGRVNHLSSDVLKKMKRSGCEIIFYGFESGNDSILRNIGKQFDVEDIINQARITTEAGIKVTGSMMVGNPGETDESIADTKQLVYKLAERGWINTVPLMPMYVLPCAPLGLSAKQREKYGYIMSSHWEEEVFSTTARHMHNPNTYTQNEAFLYQTTSGKSFMDYAKIAGGMSLDFQKNLGVTRASDAILLIADVMEMPIDAFLNRYYSNKRESAGDSLKILCDDILFANRSLRK